MTYVVAIVLQLGAGDKLEVVGDIQILLDDSFAVLEDMVAVGMVEQDV